jgi:hypothetical protein
LVYVLIGGPIAAVIEKLSIITVEHAYPGERNLRKTTIASAEEFPMCGKCGMKPKTPLDELGPALKVVEAPTGKLVASAVRSVSSGKVWTGRRHSDAIRAAYAEMHETISGDKYIQGFVDDYGTFYNRKEAFKVAVIHNQLLKPDDPWANPALMSEDLW